MTEPGHFRPDWPEPAGVHAFMTTRTGGVSAGPWSALNLATHVGDVPANVAKNRERLARTLQLPAQPCWMEQVHGTLCVRPGETGREQVEGDAAWTDRSGVVLAIMVADCLPICLASHDGSEIAVVHAGWRGLAGGVIESAVANFRNRQIMAWLGPAIGPCHYEVDRQVKDVFAEDFAFSPGRDDAHWMLDLYAVARHRLTRLGVKEIFGGNFCTWCEADRFYSYRRDGETGRMAMLLWKTRNS